MGSFEKLVILTLIFLASIVVAVNFQLDDDSTVGATDEIGSSRRVEENGRAEGMSIAEAAAQKAATIPLASGAATQDPSANAARPNPFRSGSFSGDEPTDGAGLLSATGASKGADSPNAASQDGLGSGASAAAPIELPTVLSTATGLTPSYADSGIYYYTVGPQDRTWAGLSEKFYGSSASAALLQSKNDAVGQPQPGSVIYVPSRTEGADVGRTQPYVARAPGRPAPPSPKVVLGLEQVPAAELTGQTYRTHVVGAGETLGGIAFHYYQRASLWKRIYDANRDVLVDPDRLVQGTTLKIP